MRDPSRHAAEGEQRAGTSARHAERLTEQHQRLVKGERIGVVLDCLVAHHAPSTVCGGQCQVEQHPGARIAVAVERMCEAIRGPGSIQQLRPVADGKIGCKRRAEFLFDAIAAQAELRTEVHLQGRCNAGIEIAA